MNTLYNKHLQALASLCAEDNEFGNEAQIFGIDNCAKQCTKITLQAIVDELTQIHERCKNQKFSDGYTQQSKLVEVEEPEILGENMGLLWNDDIEILKEQGFKLIKTITK